MNFSLSSFLFGALLLFGVMSCDDDDQADRRINIDDVPTEIQDYVDTYFPDNDILDVFKNVDNNVVSFDAVLEDGVELEFDEAKRITEIESIDPLPDSVVPADIRRYVTDNYPDRAITAWELENGEQTFELDDDSELVFDLDGGFLRIDA